MHHPIDIENGRHVGLTILGHPAKHDVLRRAILRFPDAVMCSFIDIDRPHETIWFADLEIPGIRSA